MLQAHHFLLRLSDIFNNFDIEVLALQYIPDCAAAIGKPAIVCVTPPHRLYHQEH
jgi:hypothetical protein